MKMNGLLMDCSRLLERHEYYHRLIDFMADWKMNTLLLNLTDDHGCALQLPGFRHLAMPNAFSTSEIGELIAHAGERAIEIIPLLQVFGHTRYLTDHPKHAHLFAGRKTRKIVFNAVDPLNPETTRIMRRLIGAVARLFPSRFLHLGCDEVNMAAFCKSRGLNEAAVWADYVNRMIGHARDRGKAPLIWGDHPADNEEIAARLRKDVILVEWRYYENPREDAIRRLRKTGFKDIVAAPSLACYLHRFLPTEGALKNTRRMARFAAKYELMGVINTIWCPWRYVQKTLYYGIAYSARVVAGGGKIRVKEFRREFARKVFGTRLTDTLNRFLTAWPKLAVPYPVCEKFSQKRPVFDRKQRERLKEVNRLGERVLGLAGKYQPAKNRDIWNAMVLAARAVWLLSESCMLQAERAPAPERRTAYNRLLREVRNDLSAEWDRGRFADDPRKFRPVFPNEVDQHMLILMNRLRRIRS